MTRGIAWDTGALILFEKRDRRALALLKRAQEQDVPMSLPATVLAEWWRDQRGPLPKVLVPLARPFDVRAAQNTGRGLKLVAGKGPSLVDVSVVVDAAQLGHVVFTEDPDDLITVRDAFAPNVQIRTIPPGGPRARST